MELKYSENPNLKILILYKNMKPKYYYVNIYYKSGYFYL